MVCVRCNPLKRRIGADEVAAIHAVPAPEHQMACRRRKYKQAWPKCALPEELPMDAREDIWSLGLTFLQQAFKRCVFVILSLLEPQAVHETTLCM